MGAIGEFKLLVNGLNLLIIPKGRMYFSLILFFFFLIGLISEIRKKRTIYTIAVVLVFFIPFAWIYQVLPVVRYVTPHNTLYGYIFLFGGYRDNKIP
ncbi:MAG: hypothetical protein KatS3mg078_1694 [Deltaproteobacteria bacterium]|nr:MAG: hypothetical protein KatS3mg078_1694 [Deltaproteobacteria bacterium]